MNVDDITQLLELMAQHDLAEFELERDGFRVRIRKAGREVISEVVQPPAARAEQVAGPPAAPALVSLAAPADESEPADAVQLGMITSPIVGTFYRSAEPNAPPFVDVGDQVKKGQVLCIIEAMKLMNEIESDCDGEIVKVFVENGKPVQFGDRMFAVKVA